MRDGSIEVAVIAFVSGDHASATSGIVIGLWSGGSMVGGLLYGGLDLKLPASKQLPWLIGALALTGLLPMLAAGPVVMGLALFAYGMCIAPFFACNSVLLGSAAPAGTTTEAFAWSSSMIFAGVALGTSVGGGLAEAHGPAAALVVTAVAGGLTLVTSLLGLKRVQAA